MRCDRQRKPLAPEPAGGPQHTEKASVVPTLAIHENAVHCGVILDQRSRLGGREDGQRFKVEFAPQGTEERSGQNHVPKKTGLGNEETLHQAVSLFRSRSTKLSSSRRRG